MNDKKINNIKKRWVKCERCTLANYRTNIVIGDLKRSPYLFVGEAPGKEEDLEGKPFIGRSGSLMRRLCLEVGLDLETVSITNTVACRPPNNRNPKKDEMKSCYPRLITIINTLKPKIIVLVGSIATNLFIPSKNNLSNMVGKLYFLDLEWKKKIISWKAIVTFHPSYLLRPNGKQAIPDFQKSIELAMRHV